MIVPLATADIAGVAEGLDDEPESAVEGVDAIVTASPPGA
jgi:hypothetical protein